jgi:hypothetical protein
VLKTSARRTGENGSGLSGDWPTPLESDDHAKVRKRGNPNLPATVMWPTPDSASGGRQPKGGMGPTGQTLDGKKRQVDLLFAVKSWPTPNTIDARGGTRSGEGQRQITFAVKEWPTPISRDHRSLRAGPETHAKNSRPLSEQVGLHDQANPNTTGKNRESLRLNHRFVEQLMGFPVGWTDVF